MPTTNLIVNGDFSSGAAGWDGTDIEARHSEHVYLQNNETTNIVAEMNGGKNAVTVMEQTFSIGDDVTREITLDAALRSSAAGTTANEDGFTVEILDSSGTVIAIQTIFPQTYSFTSFTMDVDFPEAGDYTIRLTEIGTNQNGSGAIVDNIALLVCFTNGTEIDTPTGVRPIETLRAGNLVQTANGPKEIRWIGKRRVTPTEQRLNPKLAPVTITAGALGGGLPTSDLRVSRQHRMLATSPIAERMFGTADVFVAAIKLTELNGIDVDTSGAMVTYYHMLFDDHEIVTANGAPSESLFTGPEAIRAIAPEAQEELRFLFPHLFSQHIAPQSAAFIPDGKRQRRFVERMARSGRAVIDTAPLTRRNAA